MLPKIDFTRKMMPLQKLPKNVWDFGKLIVAKALKSCPKCNKSPNLVTLPAASSIPWMKIFINSKQQKIKRPQTCCILIRWLWSAAMRWRLFFFQPDNLKVASHYLHCKAAATCDTWLGICRKMEKYLFLWHQSPLQQSQQPVTSSVNKP